MERRQQKSHKDVSNLEVAQRIHQARAGHKEHVSDKKARGKAPSKQRTNKFDRNAPRRDRSEARKQQALLQQF